jgi:hypothetical protein
MHPIHRLAIHNIYFIQDNVAISLDECLAPMEPENGTLSFFNNVLLLTEQTILINLQRWITTCSVRSNMFIEIQIQ